jgi:spindle assembly abnormal protein 6
MVPLRSRNPSEKTIKAVEEDGKEVLVRLKKDNDSSQDDRAKLKLRSRPLRNGNGLQIFLTREDDPAFYYSVDITEDDYRELRNRQGLLVDLASFPSMIYRLLDDCLAEELRENPKFFPVLEHNDPRGDEVTFEVQEINMYRRLAHVSIRLRKGNDSRVREHLGQCLTQLKQEHRETITSLQETRNDLRLATDERTTLLSDLERQRKDYSDRDVLYQKKLAKEITDERERAAKAVAEMRMSYETERRRLTEEHATSLRTLENRVAALDYDNRDLTEKKHKNEAQVQRLKAEQWTQNEELKRLRAEAEQHRLENNNLGQGKHELDRNLSRLQARVDILEQEKGRLLDDLTRRDGTIQDILEQRKRLEQEVAEKKLLVTKRETAVKNVSQELIKANEVIRKLQDQNRKENHKIKLGCQIVQEQEKVLTDKENELENTRRQLKEKTEALDACQTDLKDLEKRLDETRTVADDLAKKVKTNETVIQWLNKQLTTAQARDPGLRLGPPPDGIHFTPSAMASTSTPMSARPPPLKENKNPGLDPKYLQPSPTLANNSRQRNTNLSAGGGLIRKNLSSNNSPTTNPPKQHPQSVYFAKT